MTHTRIKELSDLGYKPAQEAYDRDNRKYVIASTVFEHFGKLCVRVKSNHGGDDVKEILEIFPFFNKHTAVVGGFSSFPFPCLASDQAIFMDLEEKKKAYKNGYRSVRILKHPLASKDFSVQRWAQYGWRFQ